MPGKKTQIVTLTITKLCPAVRTSSVRPHSATPGRNLISSVAVPSYVVATRACGPRLPHVAGSCSTPDTEAVCAFVGARDAPRLLLLRPNGGAPLPSTVNPLRPLPPPHFLPTPFPRCDFSTEQIELVLYRIKR